MEKTKIEQLYEDQKARGFVNHLIHAYLPIHKVTKIWTFSDKKPDHKCSVCGQKLIDVDTIFHRMQTTEYMKDTMSQMIKQFDGEQIDYEDRAVVKHLTHGAVIGWSGEKTTTELCQKCVQELLQLVQNGILINDKNISYQVNKMRRTSMFNSFTSSPSLKPTEIKMVEDIQKKIEKNPKHVATFGDLDVLIKLKEKMDAEEKSKTQ